MGATLRVLGYGAIALLLFILTMFAITMASVMAPQLVLFIVLSVAAIALLLLIRPPRKWALGGRIIGGVLLVALPFAYIAGMTTIQPTPPSAIRR